MTYYFFTTREVADKYGLSEGQKTKFGIVRISDEIPDGAEIILPEEIAELFDKEVPI